MAKGQVVHAGHTDPNQNASAIGVIGTLGTADTKGSALTLPAAVDADSGAWFIKQIGGTVEALPDPLGSVVVTVGTIGDLDTVGTLGVVEGGTVAEISNLAAGTLEDVTITVLPDLPGGTLDLGTVVESPATGFNGGTVSVGTAAVEITFTGSPKSVFIQADHDNGTMLYIGPSSVTQAGVNAVARLDAGEAISLDLDDSNAPIYAVGGTTAQKAYKLAIT